MWTLPLHLLVNFLRYTSLANPSYQGTQEFLRITLHLSEPPSYVPYIFIRTELTPRYPSDHMKRLYDINVHGVFYTAREAAKYMIPQGGGSIVLVASISADVGLIFWSSHPPY